MCVGARQAFVSTRDCCAILPESTPAESPPLHLRCIVSASVAPLSGSEVLLRECSSRSVSATRVSFTLKAERDDEVESLQRAARDDHPIADKVGQNLDPTHLE